MKPFFSLPRGVVLRPLTCLSRGLLAALLAGAQIFGGYAPFAVGAVAAAGPGWEGLCALVGAGLGSLALLDFPHALRTTACCLLLFTANNAFCELHVYRKSWFLPVLTGTLMLAVEFIYMLRAGSEAAVFGLLSILTAALFAYCCRQTFHAETPQLEKPAASMVVLLGVLTALASAELPSGFAPGRIAAVLTVLLLAFSREPAFALASSLCIGLAMDCAARNEAFLHTACYALGALLTSLVRGSSRVRAAVMFALCTALFALPRESEEGLILLYEGLAGTLVFLLLPVRSLRQLRGGGEEPGDSLRRRLRETAAALRELHDNVLPASAPRSENPAVIFDRAAEAVCRDCELRELCWEREYGRTYNAFNDATAALLQNGAARGEDFPVYFSDRCVRLSGFLSAVNHELRAYLLRRQYRSRLDAAHSQAADQYAQLSELLTQAAEHGAAALGTAALPYRVGASLRPRTGESVSGDCSASFETEAGLLCLLLSDGMGSGEGAHHEAALTVRLLERFLRAGIDALPALRTLNSALNLRAEQSDSFATVDLLTLDLRSGEGELYKYGAAPSYLKRGGRVRRIGCSCLPAGLAGEPQPPEQTHVRLENGSFFVMVTDGVSDGSDDAWLEALLLEWEGENPQMLAASILAESRLHDGCRDDAGVLALYLPREGAAAPEEV